MGRERTSTLESCQSTSYMILDDSGQDGILNLAPCEGSNNMAERRISFISGSLLDNTNNNTNAEEEGENDLDSFLLHASSNGNIPQLNGLNYLNVVTYIIHLFCSCIIGLWGIDHLLPTRDEMSQKHETLLTPSDWCRNFIWIPILLAETVFVVAQLLARYRARPIVQDGTGFFFFYTCLLQMAWTLCFAFAQFILSFVSVVFTLLSLALLLQSQKWHVSRGAVREEYYLFRLPFLLHFGWMTVMTMVHLCLLVRYESDNSSIHLAVDMVAFAILLAVAIHFLFHHHGDNNTNYGNFVIPSVIIWSYIGIGWRLHHPNDELIDSYGHDVIHAAELASYILAGITAVILIPSVLFWLCSSYFVINVVQLDASVVGSL